RLRGGNDLCRGRGGCRDHHPYLYAAAASRAGRGGRAGGAGGCGFSRGKAQSRPLLLVRAAGILGAPGMVGSPGCEGGLSDRNAAPLVERIDTPTGTGGVYRVTILGYTAEMTFSRA